MTYQRQSNILVALKAETTTGVAVGTVTGAAQLRIVQSPGLKLNRAVVQSEEKRSDMAKTMGRLGYRTVDGSYESELTAGGANDRMLEALMRGTWVTALVVGFATMSQVTVGTNEVVSDDGDWTGTEGIMVGDIFRLSNYSTASANDLNTRVTAITSNTISCATNAFATAGAADAAGTLTVLRKLALATSPTRRSFNFEQYDKDIDLSELFLGCRVVGFDLSCRPGAMAMITWRLLGMDRTALATGTSPFFTSPSLTTGLGLLADDSSIRFNGAAVADFNGFDLSIDIDAAGEPVIGSLTTPDIFDNDGTVGGTITGLREDFSNLTLYDAETEFEISILLQEEMDAPKRCLGIFLPRVKIQSLEAPVGGGDGAKVETLGLMVGVKDSATGYDQSHVIFHTSETES